MQRWNSEKTSNNYIYINSKEGGSYVVMLEICDVVMLEIDYG